MTKQPTQNWFTSSLILFLPVTFILFFGSQMAYSQAKGRFNTYQAIPEITTYADLSTVSSGEVVIVRGRILRADGATTLPTNGINLLIFQERPADGREIRFREAFPLTFPKFTLALPDGQVQIQPSETRKHIIQTELHAITIGDRTYTGFRAGDTVSIQGEWQAQSDTFFDVTGVSSVSQMALLAEWQQRFRYVAWARNGLGILTLLSLTVFILHLHRSKAQPHIEPAWSKAHG